MVADVKDNAEAVREFYRRQGEKRERTRILEILEKITNAPDCFELDVNALIQLIKKEEVNVQTK